MSDLTRRPWAGLQARMTLSYVGATVGVVILLEILVLLLLLFTLSTQVSSTVLPEVARQVAQKYALLAADQGQGVALDPHATLQVGQPDTLALPGHTWELNTAPYRTTLAAEPVMFVVVITPDQQVLTSSYPARFASHTQIAQALPTHAQAISDAMRGIASDGKSVSAASQVTYAIEPIWNWQKHPIGVIYVEIPSTLFVTNDIWSTALHVMMISGFVLVIGMMPVGALFGLLTTRGSVQRIRHLAEATSQFAAGNYAQRVRVSYGDEISQLEEDFNRMAVQLTENIAQRQELASQNARLAERGRISRELHDSIKQQVFAIGLQLGTALSLLERDPATATQHVRHADALAHQTQQELTTLIHELRPLALQTQDFIAALSDHVLAWGHEYAIATVVSLPATSTLPATVEDGLIRVAQEALTNVARHSQAQHVDVTLAQTGQQVTLTLVDDGRGFTPAAVAGTGVGLSSMRERMQALGGTLTIQSAPGQGTQIVAGWPHP